jgi:DNA-directed RNA polymerase subunit beta'
MLCRILLFEKRIVDKIKYTSSPVKNPKRSERHLKTVSLVVHSLKTWSIPKPGEVVAEKGEQINEAIVAEIKKRKINHAPVRSVMTCKTQNGICQQCYGYDLGNNKLVDLGTPVGIIAAQSIGEPGTQLTMRTFHMGGVAGEGDITQGLTRVEELFEARAPKTPAVLSEIDGRVRQEYVGDVMRVTISAEELGTDVYKLETGMKVVVKQGETVKQNQIIAKGRTSSVRNIRVRLKKFPMKK